MNFLRDNDDLQYYLDQGLDWHALAWVTELGYRHPDGFRNAEEAVTFYREVASLVGKFAAEDIAPYAAELDREGIRLEGGEAVAPERLDAIFRKLGELGLHGMTLPRELGGMNVPMLIYFINNELVARADAAVMAHYGFHAGSAMAMLVFSMQEGTTEIDANGRVVSTRWQNEIAEVAAGDAWGSMDITEPVAGSDMAALRMRGVQDEAGNWTVSGEKIFITSGHGKYHFIVARTETAARPDDPKSGLDGLSMFLVQAYRDGADGQRTRWVRIERLEDKLGHHAAATAALTFDRAPAQLIGKRGDGFRQMLQFMNNARLGVGYQSIGVCEAALRLARAYASERRSMGKTIDHHEMIADYLAEMEIDVVGLRALAMHGAFNEELYYKKTLFKRYLAGENTGVSRLEREARAHRAASRRATPLLKYLAAEKSVEMARRCLQIHGGYGYMREYAAEKLVRDALVFPIYEGTSQIQALMAMKDTLSGILKAPQDFLKRLAQARWRAVSARDPLERRAARLQQLSLAAQQHLMTQTLAAKVRTVQAKPIGTWPQELLKQWNPKRDFSLALLHAERLTRLLCDELIVELLLKQARQHPSRAPLLEQYLERAEPRARFLHDEIITTGRKLLDRLEDASDTNTKAAG